MENSAVGEQQVASMLRQVEDSIAASVVGEVPSAVGEGRDSAVGETPREEDVSSVIAECGIRGDSNSLPITRLPVPTTQTQRFAGYCNLEKRQFRRCLQGSEEFVRRVVCDKSDAEMHKNG